MKVCVVALGKIGLPLAVQFAQAGHHVIGVDISSSVVDLINSGKAPFPGEEGLEERLEVVLSNQTFKATTDTCQSVAESEVVVVVVPLIVDENAEPDFSALDAATTEIGKGLKKGTLVSYETTIPVHTTRQRFGPALEKESGLKAGEDFFLSHSPERVFSGRIFSDLRAYPKLVGGINKASTEKAIAFYESALEFDIREELPKSNGVWSLDSVEAAELAKLAETTYRDINIGFANQLAMFADQIKVDIDSVIEACNTQPFSHIHRPGISVGGHCIPVYPRFYLFNDPSASIPAAAREANLAMPSYAVNLLFDELSHYSNPTVLILGAAYRGGVKETAFSGVFDIAKEITNRSGIPIVHDPLYSSEEIEALGLTPFDSSSHNPVGAILHTDHLEYKNLDDSILCNVEIIIDGRNWIDSIPTGVRRITIGRGETSGAKQFIPGSQESTT